MFPRASGHSTFAEQRADSVSDGDELADLLSDPHCKHLLEYLRENKGPVPLATVSKYVVAKITDTPEEDVPESAHRRVQVWFHTGQLPVLADYGVVDFDPESGTVRLAADDRDDDFPVARADD